MFPDDDERWRDADSIDLLRTVVGTIAGAIVNVDATRDLRAARASAPTGPRWSAILGEATSRPGQRQGDEQRGDGLDRARRGHRLHRGRDR